MKSSYRYSTEEMPIGYSEQIIESETVRISNDEPIDFHFCRGVILDASFRDLPRYLVVVTGTYGDQTAIQMRRFKRLLDARKWGLGLCRKNRKRRDAKRRKKRSS